MKNNKIITAIVLGLLLMNIVGCGTSADEDINSDDTSSPEQSQMEGNGAVANISGYTPKVLFKADGEYYNPLITNIFCADPTAVEYNGRLYVYGTSDNQQYLKKPDADNTYECIKSFVIMSTDDMVNWRYEGTIDTASIAPWIWASWAPSVT